MRDSQKNPSWSIMDIKTHYMPTETFQHTHVTVGYPPPSFALQRDYTNQGHPDIILRQILKLVNHNYRSKE